MKKERTAKGKKFRKGMKVCSIYDPERAFVIDKSLLPSRMFHEKGATRWYTKRELRPPNSRVKPAPQAKAGTLFYERSRAFQGMALISRQQPKFICAECRVRFERKPKARPLKPGELAFCCGAHRTAHWKRQDRPQAKVRGPQGLAATALSPGEPSEAKPLEEKTS